MEGTAYAIRESAMTKFKVLVQYCDRYEVEAEDQDTAIKNVSAVHYDERARLTGFYASKLNRSHATPDLNGIEAVDAFTSFKVEGEVDVA
jgi:hypothetical protein